MKSKQCYLFEMSAHTSPLTLNLSIYKEAHAVDDVFNENLDFRALI